MTPKERLKRLESYSVCDNYREKEEDFRSIEKDLEVLAILKAKVFNKLQCFDLEKRWYDDSFDLTDIEVKKIKEWLRNAK